MVVSQVQGQRPSRRYCSGNSAGWQPRVVQDKLDGRRIQVLQMRWKEQERPAFSMMVPPSTENKVEWAKYRLYHVASSQDEVSGLYGPAIKLKLDAWTSLSDVHPEVV